MEIFFAHLNGEFEGKTLYDRKTLLQMMRILRAFDVGRTEDGKRLLEPADEIPSPCGKYLNS
jgi:hypothetical protein